MMMNCCCRRQILHKISHSFLRLTSIAPESTFPPFHSTSVRCFRTADSRRIAVKLAYTSYEPTNPQVEVSGKSPVIIQHGLLGSRKNWASLAKVIHQKTGRKVIVPDARNHGDSPHSEELKYDVLAMDIEALMNDLNIPRAVLIGHSMGGRAMMTLALEKPTVVEKLVVVDISPVNVSPGAEAMKNFLSIMEQVRFDERMQRSTARKIVDDHLQTVIKDSLLRQFLLTNLVEDNGRFRWRVNLKAIINNLHHIIGHFSTKNRTFSGPTLFVGGGRSDYIRPNDHALIRQIFLNSEFQYVPDAGHWVHSEKPAEFLEILLKFINQKSSS